MNVSKTRKPLFLRTSGSVSSSAHGWLVNCLVSTSLRIACRQNPPQPYKPHITQTRRSALSQTSIMTDARAPPASTRGLLSPAFQCGEVESQSC